MAEIDSAFVVPPYKPNESVVGIEHWELQAKEEHPVFANPKAALIIDSPVGSSSQLHTLDLKTILKNRGAENLGDRLVVETQFALDFEPEASFDGGLSFRFGSLSSTPLHFGFYLGDGGGLYFQGKDDRVVLLSKAAIQKGVSYKFVVHVDLSDLSFRVTVTSLEEMPFRYESGKVSFQNGFDPSRKIRELVMGNNKPTYLSAYVDYVKVFAE